MDCFGGKARRNLAMTSDLAMTNKGTKMSKIKENRPKRVAGEMMFVELGKSIEEISEITGASTDSLYYWHKRDGWADKRNESHIIERSIDLNTKKALNTALKAYVENPENKDLQSLVSLLRQHKDKKPNAQYKEHVLRYIDKTVDYFLQKGMSETADVFKASAVDLAEYLLHG